jgi:hypothetical protein
VYSSPSGEQQQDHADLGAGGGELLTGRQWQQPTVPEREPGDQVQRDR